MSSNAEATSPVRRALAALSVALDGLVSAVDDGGLEHFDDVELVEFLQDFERVRNQLPLVDHRALRDAEERKLAEVLCQGRLSRVLTQALRLSPAEANRRVRAAEELGGQTSMLGQPLAPELEVPAVRIQLLLRHRPVRVEVVDEPIDTHLQVLRREVTEERHLRDSRGGGDLGDSGVVVALRSEEP